MNLIKKEIENYEILKELGEGKFGKVFLGRPKGREEFIAIKVLDKK